MIRESLGSDSATTRRRSGIGVVFDVGVATVVFFRGRTIGGTTDSVTGAGAGEALIGRSGWSVTAVGSGECCEDCTGAVSGALAGWAAELHFHEIGAAIQVLA
jgi:outer membrane lipoprotein SlyB